MFADLIDHYRAINPELIFLLENVEMEGWCQEIISERLGVDPVKINGSLVSAQNRVRLFWTNLPVEGKPKDRGILLKHILELEVGKKYYVSEKVLARLSDPKTDRNYLQESIRNGDEKSKAAGTGAGRAGNKGTPALIAVVNNNGILSEREKSLAIDANYHKGMDNHGQRTMIHCSGDSLYALSEGPFIDCPNCDSRHPESVSCEEEVRRSNEYWENAPIPESGMALFTPNIFGGDRIHEDKAPTILANPNGGTKNPMVIERARGINRPSRGIEIRKDEKAASVKAGESGTQKPKVFLEYTEPVRVHSLEPRNGKGNGGKGPLSKSPEKTYCVNTWNGQAVEFEDPFLGENHSHREPRRYYGKSQSLLSHMGTGGNNVPYVNNIRRLTEVEVARLFTLPDKYCDHVSSTQQYKAMGNGFIVDVVAWIFGFIGQPLRNHRSQRRLF